MRGRPDATRPGDEAGFTLIELVVSLVLLTVGVFSLMQVFYSGLRVTLSADSRTRATAVASREIESMRSVAYTNVGMDAALLTTSTYADSDGTNYAWVTGGTVAPTASQTVSGTVLTVSRAIVWASVGSNSQAYKRCVVTVSWHDQAGTHSLRQDGAVYPGGLGPAVTTGSTSTTSTTVIASLSAPVGLVAVTDTVYPTTAINLTWTPGATAGTTWEVDHSVDPLFSSSVTVDTTNLPTGQTTFQKTGLASGTTFYFRVRALAGAANSSWSNVAGAVTTSPPAPVCAIGTANVTPAAVNKANNGNDALSSDLYVSVHTSGVCTGLRLRFTSAVGAAQANRPLVQRTGGVWDDTIDNAAYGWDTGNKTLLVTDSSGSPLASIALLVCAKGNSCP